MSGVPATTKVPPIPVTVIGGYLGAGKTTLVNHLLRHADGLKLAVMVNDFGALPIDRDLIESESGNVIGIAGGCVCCSYGSELIDALIDMQARTPRPDAMIIETSGVALPGPVASSVTLVAGYEVDGIVVLADAETLRERGMDRYLADTIERQLSDSNLVVLNKVDLVDEQSLAATRRWIEGKAPRARVIEASQSTVPLDVIIGGRLGYQAPSGFRLDRHSMAGYATRSFDLPPGIDPHRLAEALSDPALGLLRAKGFASGADSKVYAVQVVGSRANVAPAATAKAGLVVIGLKAAIDFPAIERVVGSAGRPTK